MACQLYTENDISALYTIVRGEILDRMNDPKLGKFDNKALDKFIREIYEEFKDEPNGLLYAQAVPDILDLVKNDLEIKKYLRQDAGLSFDYLQDLSLEFEDPKNVLKFVTPKTTTKTKKDVDKKIKESNKTSKNVVQNNDNNAQPNWSAVQEKAKVDYPDKTSDNVAIAKNPDKMTEEERNQEDQDKKLFFEVVKTAVVQAKKKDINDNVMLGDKAIMLRAQNIRDLNPDDLTNYDKTFLSKNRTYDINIAIISDAKGNPIRFDENSNIVETGGRIVYQYIRPVVNQGGKLYLGNRSGFLYTLIPAETLAAREIKEGIAEGNLYGEQERQDILNKIKNTQKQKMNDLLRLNNRLSTSTEPVLLPITGGSFGIVERKSELISNTNFADDLSMIYTYDSGVKEGYSFFMVNKFSAGVAVNSQIYLQKMDMPESLADNLGKILATKGLLNGEPLSPQAKLEYYNTFLSNRVETNNINVEINEVLGVNQLTVTIKDPLTGESTVVDLEKDDAASIISNHLKKVKVITKNDGTQISYPASMSYMKSFAEDGAIQKGVRFTDYEINQNKDGIEIIKEVQKDYFGFIKPLAKVDYTIGDVGYFAGVNAYLEFAVPIDLETPMDEQIDIGIPKESNLTSDDVDNGTQDEVKKEEVEEEEEEGVKFTIETKQSTLPNDKTLVANINEADVVFGLGTKFTTPDEKLVQQRAGAVNKWYGLKIGSKSEAPKNLIPPQNAIDLMVSNLSKMKGNVVNIVGNDIAQLAKDGYTQAEIDKYIYNILKEVVKDYPISKIISNGQTGIAEASIKAAKKLGIPVKIRAFTGYALRTQAPYLASGLKSTKNTKADFLSRFLSKSTKTYKKAANKVTQPVDTSTVVPAKPTIPAKTVEQQKVQDRKINKISIDDLLNGTDLIPDLPGMDRNKRAASVMNQLYGSARAWEDVNAWFDKSPLKGVVDVERLALVFNSSAYGTFLSAGSLLSDAANKLREEGFAARIELYGDAQPITLYHEAWHAFSQLVLTIEEKTALYNHIRTFDKWANKEFIEIEEDLAEDFIDYAVNGKKQSGIIQTIFNKIKKIIDFFFGKTTKRDVTRLYDIPMVKEYYNNLYTGNFTVDTENAEHNLMPGFQRLNSAKKTIQPITSTGKDFTEITDVQSNKIVDLMDSLMARTFYKYNTTYGTTSGAVRLLSDITNRQKLYSNIEKQLNVLLDNQIEVAQSIAIANADPTNKNPDFVAEQKEMAKLDLLMKAVENYGVVDEALSKKTDKGVVAFHMQRSRFNILKDAYNDDTEDATVALFKTEEGNSISAKQLATDDTMMMLSGIYQLNRDENGDYLIEENENGVKTYSVKTDDFGLPMLEPVDVMWARLARTLQGSMDFLDMYDRMKNSIENYPEFIQVLEILPNPYQFGPLAYNNNTEFKSETNFWQDLKKPVIPFIQLNINKTVIEKAKQIDGKRIPEKSIYEARLAAANFDIYRIINDWTTNFNVADSVTNRFIEKDGGNNYLNVNEVIKEFTLDKKLNPSKAGEFLAALGIQLDMTSADIRNVVRNKEKPFASRYNIDFIYDNVRLVYLASKSNDIGLMAAAEDFKRQPLYYLMNEMPKAIVDAAGGKARDVRSKITTLAQLQNRFSDGYSNYSVLTPEKNRVWEQFLDNTVTRIVTSINKASSWQQLTMKEADPNGRFQHMRWLSEENNPSSAFSVILNSIFDLNPMSPNYGEKFPGAELLLENIGGTQIIDRENNETTGTSTANTDVTSKFLQEMHTMLQSGVVEFMRHASKQTAMNLRAKKVNTYSSKRLTNLYVDIMAFSPSNTTANNNLGESEAFNVLLGYIAAEAGRIYRFKSNKEYFGKFSAYNRNVVRKDNGQTVKAGEAFTAFDDVLSAEVQGDLYALIDKTMEDALETGYFNPEDFNLKDIVNENPELRRKIKNDVIQYFNAQTQQNYSRLEDARYIDQSLYDMVSSEELSKDQVDKMLVKAYTYNYWIHNFETTILAYGDTVQYNHDKEEFHKRNAGLGSGGRGFRADYRARMYINSPMYERLYAEKYNYEVRPYDGTLNTAIIKEEEIGESKYKSEYYDAHVKDYTQRYLKAGKSKAEAERLAKELATIVLKDYSDMKIADGQGWIGFEAYKMLKNLEGNWTTQQENLYKRIVNNETITASEIREYFPPYKLQYYGNIKVSGLPLTSFHKFSLAPLIPTVHTANTRLGQIHDMMMKQGIDYVLMESGEKVGHFGSGDNIVDKNGNIDTSVTLTKNVIFAEYLKNQTEVNSKYKQKSIFSTQLRKLVLEGMYENGQITVKKHTKLIENYVNRVSEYTELLKNELVDELGFEETESGEFIPVNKDSIAKLAKMIRDTLTRDDVYSDNLIDIIDVTDEGDLRFDLSLHPEAVKIEKLLLSLINKRIIKQKVKGEPLVQKSSAFYDGLFELPIDLDKMSPAARETAVKKYMGSNFLPTYHRGADGKTTAMKVTISLQGDYESLLNLEYKGEPIGTIDRLNEAIKDDEWLDANDKNNRKAITMVGVRIPVQGLNSMEFMEVYHFLPAEAGNIIIPPAEIVAKSGADFDIDKLSIFMNNIDSDGNVKQTMFENAEEFYNALKDPAKYDMTKQQMYAMQKAGLENALINDIRSILELPENFVSLTTPNGTYLVKPIADRLAQSVMDYSPLQNMMTKDKDGNLVPNLSAPDKSGKQKEVISPTRIFEVGYNLYKHESNVVGKKTLGLGAIENTFNVIFNSLGATMPPVYKHSDEEMNRISFLGLRHHTTKKNGQDVISLSNQYDVDGVNKIADVISQLINGWVDVEKDAWIFFVQGNYEVAPILLYLLKTGVPVEEAVYFVSQPLVRDYVKEKRLAQSTFAEPLRRDPGYLGVSFKAASNVISKNFKNFLADDQVRYTVGKNMMDEYFKNKSEDNKHFTKEEMLNLITESKNNPEKASSDLSRTMFLHYLTIEKQIEGITALKMASNPDTALNTDVGQAIQAESNIEALALNTKIDQDLRLGMINDSIISSFFNSKLVKGLAKPLFKFRYDEDIQDYIQSYVSDFKNAEILKAAFGYNYRDIFPVVFRNDILSYLFQNTLRKYSLGKEYSSYALSDNIKITPAAGLKFGARVVDTAGGPTMVVDRVQIEKEFFDKSYLRGSEAKNSYEDRGLYALEPGHFGSNVASNKEEYIRFVVEREYLRHVMPFDEVVKTQEFKKELENVKKTSVRGVETENRRYTYEKIIASRALDNTLNPYHLFNDKENAYAVRLERLKTQYRTELFDNYPVLSRIVIDTNQSKTMFNLYIDDKDMTSFKSNLYSRNFEELSNRAVKKVEDKDENDRISDFFAKITYIAMLQSGTNKSKYNFLSLTDFDKFIDVMNDETAKFLESPVKLKMLVDFKNKFEQVNSKTNRDKYRFKNYLTGLDVQKSIDTQYVLSKIPDSETITSEDIENAERLVERKNLIPTISANVFVYNDLSGSEKAYQYIVDNNQDITFIYQLSLAQKEAYEKMTPEEFNKRKLKGQVLLKKIANSSSVGIVTGLDKVSDAFSTLDKKYYDNRIADIELAIAEINQVIEKGGKVAFSINGYGDPALMPKELFVYLSRRLFEEFQYLNPGSEFAKEVSSEVAKYQPVTDAEILAKFEGENNPLNCM